MTTLFYPLKIKNFLRLSLAMFCLVAVLLFLHVEAARVYGPSPHFHSGNQFITVKVKYQFKQKEYCGYNSFTPGNTNAICLFAYPQPDVVRVAISLTQVSKPSGSELIFSTSFTLSVNYPHTSMTITVGNGISAALKLGFTVLIIKTPPSPTMPYIDIIFFSKIIFLQKDVGPGSPLHNSSPTIRSVSDVKNINTNSIFTTVDATTINLIPFTVHLTHYIDSAVINDPRWQHEFMYNFLVAPLSSTSIKQQLYIQPHTTMSSFFGFTLLININLFKNDRNAFIANPGLTPNDHLLQWFQIGDPAKGALTIKNFQSDFPYFGTSFDHKCILGISRVKFTRMTQFQFHMQNNTYGNYQSYTQSLTTPSKIPASVIAFFCHGYNVECSDSTPYFDWTDGNCYTKATCPLPVPNAMPYQYRCSWCIQFICLTCNLANRAECITCAPSTNSVLNTVTKKCQCSPGYFPVYIDLAPQSFLGVTQSLISCTSNCTQSMQGCKHDKCTSQSYCAECLPSHILTPSGFNQYCVHCNNYLANCLQCSNAQYCTICQDGYYRYDVKTNPPAPNTPQLIGRKCAVCLSNCKECPDGSTCNKCFDGYNLQPSNTVCKCDPIANNLQNCQSCTVKTTCATCNSGYFVSPITGLCVHCVANHIGCKTCINQNTCTSCIDGYRLINLGARTECQVCYLTINYCDKCIDLSTCMDCMVPFGLQNPSLCTHCSVLKCAGCIECLDGTSPCTKCDSLSFLINGTCFFCEIVHPQCLTCQINPTYQNLDCIQCKPGYYLNFNPLTNTQQCLPCINVIHKCIQCQNSTFCTKCQFPNELSPNNLCQYCNINFANYDGKCMEQAGCMSVYQTNPGNQTCLACRDNLHYFYEYNHHVCDCMSGYIETINPVSSRKCVPICGDGILISPDQQCDDSNIIEHDGCNSNCRIEKNFKCSQDSPSKCVLYQNFIKFEFVYVERVLSENKGILHFLIEPEQVGLSTVDWSQIMSFNFSSTAVNLSQLSYKYVVQRGQLLVTVPYSEDLQTSHLKFTIHFDPDTIVSEPSFFTSTQQLAGINAPLIIEDPFLLSTCRILGIVSLVLSILALVQFYVGSYMNKMIGLQTIQIIQLTFFIRVVVSNQNTSIINCLNSLKYCSTGYSNSQVIFGTVGIKKSQQILHEFLQIGIEKYFLMNVNFWLIPVALAVVIYFLLMIRRQTQKRDFLEGKETQSREKFIKMHRSLEWMYNHFVFPQVMMLAMIVHFSVILSLQLNENYGTNGMTKIYMQSIRSEMILLFGIYAIFTHEIFQSINNLLNPFRQQPLSALQKLQNDEQSPDRPNYRPFYVFVYLAFYFIQILVISIGVQVLNFHFTIETVLGLNILYLFAINSWQPYSKAIKIHNTAIKFNIIVIIVCLGIYQIVHRTQRLSSLFYITLVSIMLVFIFLLIIFGFYRAFAEYQYRKKLTFSSKNKFPNDTDLFEDNKKLTQKQRRQGLLQKNPYAFKNQLLEFKKNHHIGREINKLTQQDEKQIIQKIRNQLKAKSNFYTDLTSGRHHNQSLQGSLLYQQSPNLRDRANFQSKKFQNSSDVKQQGNEMGQRKRRKSSTKKVRSSMDQSQKQALQRLRNRLKAQWSYLEGL